MTIGSLDTWYTSGTLWKKYGGSNASRLNERSLEAYDAEVLAAGSRIFGQSVDESYGLSELAAQAMQRRVAEELTAKIDDATATKDSALNILA